MHVSNAHGVFEQIKFWSVLSWSNLSLVDNMVRMLEKYSGHLEELVQERTTQLLEEKRKTDSLLYRMLPPYVFFQDAIVNLLLVLTY